MVGKQGIKGTDYDADKKAGLNKTANKLIRNASVSAGINAAQIAASNAAKNHFRQVADEQDRKKREEKETKKRAESKED